MGRVVELAELEAIVETGRDEGLRFAFANGHFDLLHVGHLRYLQDAKRTADRLIVGLNGDRSVALLKGPGRPLVPSGERAELLAALEPVDYVVVFDDETPIALLSRLEPDLHCKGTDYEKPEKVPEYGVVQSYGGRTVLVGDPKEHSTRDLIAALRALDPPAE